jgi:hypothetical protein
MTMQRLDIVAQAGAIAVSPHSSEIAIGTRGGVVRLGYPALDEVSSLHDLWKQGCNGAQYRDGGLVLLGHDLAQSFSKPADWQSLLVTVDRDGVRMRFVLGPGNWAMVKGLHGSTAVLYDTSEDQGVKAISTGSGRCVWSMKAYFERIVSCGEDRALGLTRGTLTDMSVLDGTLTRHQMPSCDGATWTAAAIYDGHYLLGGYSRDRAEYALAMWQPGGVPHVRWATSFRRRLSRVRSATRRHAARTSFMSRRSGSIRAGASSSPSAVTASD